MPRQWVADDIEAAKELLGRCRSVSDACGIIGCTPDALQKAMRRFGQKPPFAFVGRGATAEKAVKPAHNVGTCADVPTVVAQPQPPTGPVSTAVRRLLDAVRRAPLPFDELCDQLDLTPGKCRALIEEARSAGHAFDVAHDHVGFVLPEPTSDVVDVGAPATSGERQTVAVISDTQFGSKYCMRAAIRDFVEYAYGRGVREILHAGDWLDGCYKHGIFELSHSGIEDQTRDSLETMPALPGLSYHAISGNHDDTFADVTGMAPGDYIEWYFRSHGRNDVKFYGRRGAYLKVRGATVELWHPKKGAAYALSYHLQNHIRDYGVGQKPDILIAGHWHINCFLEQRGVQAIACPCFQSPKSAFSKSLGGAPSIGGLILSWELTEKRTVRRFAFERSSYYEREELRGLELA